MGTAEVILTIEDLERVRNWEAEDAAWQQANGKRLRNFVAIIIVGACIWGVILHFVLPGPR